MELNYWIVPGLDASEKPSDAVITTIIFSAVEIVTSYSYDTLTLKKRKRSMVHARQLIFYFLKKYTSYTLKNIGKFFGKDHTTVIHGIQTINDLLYVEDKEILEWEQDINILIRQSINNTRYDRDK